MELLTRRLVEWSSCVIVESLNRRMVEWNGGVVEWWNSGDIDSSESLRCRVVELSNR